MEISAFDMRLRAVKARALWDLPGQCFIVSHRRKNFTKQQQHKLRSARQLPGGQKNKAKDVKSLAFY